MPEASVSTYQQADNWKEFTIIASIPTGIQTAKDSKSSIVSQRYNLGGQRTNGKQRGINIIKMDNGTTKKVVNL